MISKFTKQLKSAAVIGALFFGSNAFAQLGLTWAEMGPNDIAGRCRSIIVDNTDATGNKLFAAGVSGGVFKTSNGGSTWSPVNDQAQSLIVSCMGQDAAGNVYFGTGETFGRGGDANGASGVLGGAGLSGFIGTGLYKINANTSTVVQVKDSLLFGNINEIAVAATNTIYVAAQKGFFISTDGGANFTEETASASGTLAAMDVKVAKNGDVYYSAGAKDYSLSAVYYAAAGSSVYTAITPTVITNRGRIEISPSPVDPNYVYLSIAKMKSASTASTGGLSAVLVSDTKGSTWSVISLGTAQFDPFTALNGTGYGDYAHTISADPINAKVCYLGSDVFYVWNQITSNPLGQGNWNQIGTNIPVPFAFYIHSNIHDVKFNAGNNSMYIATDAGIYKSVSNNSGFLPYNNGLNISQFNSVTFPNYPRVNQGTPTNVAIPYAGVAGGSVGNSLTYLPGNYLTGIQTSNSAGSSDAFQSDFSKVLPKALFYAGANGTVLRTSDIDLTPASTFYDNSYRGGGTGGPGSINFANENTPMRLWENYQGNDYGIFFNENTQTQLANFLPAKASYTVSNTRAQASSRYDSIFVTTSSTKSIQTTVVTTSVANTNSVANTFTINNTRPSIIAKYDSIVIKTTSTKLAGPFPANQTITFKVAYTGSVATGYLVTGNASVTPASNNMVFNYSGLTDSIRFTFNTVPDSCTFSVRYKYKYYQNLTILPVYTGTAISSYNVIGEANTTSTTNNMVYLNANQIDSIRYTFATPVDSSIIKTAVKYRYDVGDVITLENKDISGNFFTSSVTLTTSLLSSVAPKPTVLVPLQKSARLAVGLKAKSTTEAASIFVVKRPLNFSINPDWVKIVGKNSRMDGPGGVASTVAVVSVVSGTNIPEITRLEWSPSGKYIYYSVKSSNSAYYLFRVSHLEFIGDSAAADYSGTLSSDVDSTGGTQRKSVLQRTTPIARFTNPITGIAVNNSEMLMVTTGGYNNTLGTVYYSNSSAATMNMNITDASNFSVKNGTTLPITPAYTGIFEMSNNNTALVGTEEGVYSTLDITQPSPTWVKEGGGNFPNVPVFQLRQQTYPSYLCYNSGIIYAATHGRGIWSTDKFFTPYAIGVEEQEAKGLTDSNIKVFPNPAGDATNLWFKAAGDASYKVTVYDINGRIMMQEATGKLMEGEQRLVLNTTQLTSGMYFITVSGTNNFNANSKLVITH